MIVINKYDLNIAQSETIEKHALAGQVSVVGKLPYDHLFNEAMIMGKTIFEYNGYSNTCALVEQVWENVKEKLYQQKTPVRG